MTLTTSARKATIAALLLLLSGCASIPGKQQRIDHADKIAGERDWHMQAIPAGVFTLAAYSPRPMPQTDLLTIYVEGDGLAWIGSSQPSLDPTPVKPVALEMALRHPHGPTAYLARPCQFIRGEACGSRYWTSHRFSEEVIESANRAVDSLKTQARARKLELVGYSGGGAVAALVAARRKDIARLITVAGNLDHVAWTRLHRASPLMGSLNPADAWKTLQDIPQLHFVGELDKNVTTAVVESYLRRFTDPGKARVQVVKGFDHGCCWARDWKKLISEAAETGQTGTP